MAKNPRDRMTVGAWIAVGVVLALGYVVVWHVCKLLIDFSNRAM